MWREYEHFQAYKEEDLYKEKAPEDEGSDSDEMARVSGEVEGSDTDDEPIKRQ